MPNDYYYAPGMMHPYWVTHNAENYPKPGESTMIAHNQEADTDMGDLYGDEFFDFFPTAMPITEEQYNQRSVRMRDWVKWKRKQKIEHFEEPIDLWPVGEE